MLVCVCLDNHIEWHESRKEEKKIRLALHHACNNIFTFKNREIVPFLLWVSGLVCNNPIVNQYTQTLIKFIHSYNKNDIV